MTRCERCERLPTLIEGAKALYIWPPTGHTAAKIASITCSQEVCMPIAGGFHVDFDEARFIEFLREADTQLGHEEKVDTLCLVHRGDKEPTLADFGDVQNLRKVIALYAENWLEEVFNSDKLFSHFQPIVHSQNPEKEFAHECLLRLKDGEKTLPPGEVFRKAKDADMLFQLDRRARETHIRNAAKQVTDSKFFINFTPTSIYDPNNCLKTTFSLIEEAKIEPSKIVFEIIETEKVEDVEHLKSILKTYQSKGFEVALDDLGAGHSTLSMLGDLMPDYVKLDMELVRNVHRETFKSELLKWIITLSHQFDIRVIAEGIECAEEADWLRANGVDYMQGFYFARPQAMVRG